MQRSHYTNGRKSQKRTKNYIELTTGSLLGKSKERQRLGRHLSSGGFLIVLPEDYPHRLRFITGLAQKLREAGRDVRIYTL